MKWRYCLWIFLFSYGINSSLSGQSFTYIIKAVGIKTGTMTVQKSLANGLTTYNMESDAGVNYLFGKMEVKNTSTTVFKDGKLYSAYSRTDKNGSLEQYCSVKQAASGGYSVQTEKGSSTLSEDITFTMDMLYYVEPVGISRIFFNIWGQFSTISEVSSHKYCVMTPDGKKNHYTYENGKMIEMEVPSAVGQVHVKLSE